MSKRDPVHDYLAGIGRRGGSSTSKAKADAARRNGCKGGRPPRRGCHSCGRCLPNSAGYHDCFGVDNFCNRCNGFKLWISRRSGPTCRLGLNERSESKAGLTSARKARPSKKKKP